MVHICISKNLVALSDATEAVTEDCLLSINEADVRRQIASVVPKNYFTKNRKNFVITPLY